MIWLALSRALPSTWMLSTMGVAVSWARSAAGPARRRATAAMIGPKRCISTGRRVGAPAPGGAGAGGSGLGTGQRLEHQAVAVRRYVDFDLVAAAELAHQDFLAQRILH